MLWRSVAEYKVVEIDQSSGDCGQSRGGRGGGCGDQSQNQYKVVEINQSNGDCDLSRSCGDQSQNQYKVV